MDKIVTHGTSTSQWQTLVIEASQACAISLSEEIQSYLVFLLMRFSEQPELAKDIMALEFLESLQQSAGKVRSERLQTLGDKCLLLAGLFPGRAERRRVHVSYFVELGQRAYALAANVNGKNTAALLHLLCQKFVALMDILLATRALSGKGIGLTPLEAEALWHDTGSQRALVELRRYTSPEGYPLFRHSNVM